MRWRGSHETERDHMRWKGPQEIEGDHMRRRENHEREVDIDYSGKPTTYISSYKIV